MSQRIFRSLAVLFQSKNGVFQPVSNHWKNRGNEGNFVMTKLNAASQPIKSHVAVRAKSEQTRKHWSLLTTSDPWMIHPRGSSKGCLDGVHVCLCVRVLYVEMCFLCPL